MKGNEAVRNDSKKVRRLCLASLRAGAGIRKECRNLNEQARKLRLMKVAFTNLEATLLLLTQHELNYKMQDPDGVELFNFQVALADLVEGAKHAVDCYDRVDTPSWEIADLRTSAA